MNADEEATRDRAIGALVGLACGDAVGTTLEFLRPGSFEPIDDLVGGGSFGLEAGQWTDDTSMALCLAESILDRDGLDPGDQMRRYLLWRNDGYLASNGRCFDIGTTTARALARFESTGDPSDPNPDDEAAANGSLMRLAAVPIRWHTDVAVAAERSGASSTTTHPAQRPTDACRVLGAMVAALVLGEPSDAVLDPTFWRFGELHPAVASVAQGSWQHKAPPAIRGSGYSVDALEAALWAVDGAVDFRSAVLRAANLGDDADTTAAIAGQLAGSRWGVSGIPGEWRSRLTALVRITSLADNLWTMAAGRTPRSWAHDGFVHAWWVEPGRVLAGEYPGDPDHGRAADKVAILVDAGVRTFVDLTGPADRLVPYAKHVTTAAEARQLDLRHLSFPIPDLSVIDDRGYGDIIGAVRAEADRGPVYVHCWGGVGRTATVVGCLLVDAGLDFDGVLARLAELRTGTRKANRTCPETSEQCEVLRRRCDSRSSQ